MGFASVKTAERRDTAENQIPEFTAGRSLTYIPRLSNKHYSAEVSRLACQMRALHALAEGTALLSTRAAV